MEKALVSCLFGREKMKRIEVPTDRLDDLRKVTSLPPSEISAIIGALSKAEKRTDVSALVSAISSVVGDDIAHAVFRTFAGLNILRDDGESSRGIVDALIAGVAKNDHEIAESIRAQRKLYEELISSPQLFLPAKLISILSSRNHSLEWARIYVDARPIFDVDREVIEVMVPTFSLYVSFLGDSHDQKELRLSLKKSDIEKLKAECDRALYKVEELKKSLSQMEGVEIAGDKIG